MKYIRRISENFRGVNLILTFKNDEEYQKAIHFFNDESDFTPFDFNEEFKSISFHTSNQEDANVTEKYIYEELINNGFENFYFESE